MCRFRDSSNVLRDLARSFSRIRHIARHLVRRRTLLLDRRGNRAGNIVDLLNDRCDAADRFYSAVCVALDCGDLSTDIFRRFCSLPSQFFDFVGYDCESLASLSGASRFNRSVERQKLGLLRDRCNYFDYFADLGAGISQLPNRTVGRLCCLHGVAG